MPFAAFDRRIPHARVRFQNLCMDSDRPGQRPRVSLLCHHHPATPTRTFPHARHPPTRRTQPLSQRQHVLHVTYSVLVQRRARTPSGRCTRRRFACLCATLCPATSHNGTQGDTSPLPSRTGPARLRCLAAQAPLPPRTTHRSQACPCAHVELPCASREARHSAPHTGHIGSATRTERAESFRSNADATTTPVVCACVRTVHNRTRPERQPAKPGPTGNVG